MKKSFLRLARIAGLVVVTLAAGTAGEPGTENGTSVGTLSVIQPGEVLQYAVSWNMFRLGTIAVITKCDSTGDSNRVCLVMHVLSNPALPFVDIREFNESKVDVRTLMSEAFRGTHCTGEECIEIRYEYLGDARAVRVMEWVRPEMKQLVPDSSFPCPPFVDGPSLFFFSRAHSLDRGSLDVPTLVGGNLSSTHLEFDGTRENVEVDCVDYPVATRKISGSANWQGGGAAGMTGRFRGWFSDDAAAVPLVAEMEIILGSIRIELEAWQRTGWNPPPADTNNLQMSGRQHDEH